ncbi:hypothetical protein, unlikely [Trypanosoma brucei gambiense DAL972]|uniref:Uncharacterized protein n=1 Tax=Trypanosoma brucei gambiense (strain MHOM/CI/86/DAL972) TaxID=679716 RepID=C9ZUT8_TRYB9|nr:hypothetical protein, unlikely [Trypanosoma brucei gambiense DAL972]CBH13176.1 hypothetical protein, unlikely [Trypanosoma brucei gambiense DAL972]|eukprot:XP_011775453.1 hypothetical protein, unlikely [Trypanosoma brucei gambiense DAL972]
MPQTRNERPFTRHKDKPYSMRKQHLFLSVRVATPQWLEISRHLKRIDTPIPNAGLTMRYSARFTTKVTVFTASLHAAEPNFLSSSRANFHSRGRSRYVK